MADSQIVDGQLNSIGARTDRHRYRLIHFFSFFLLPSTLPPIRWLKINNKAAIVPELKYNLTSRRSL